MEEATVTLTRQEYKDKSQKVFNKFMDSELENKQANPIKVMLHTLIASIIIDEVEKELFGEKENN